MPQITTRIPEELFDSLERAAQTLHRKRADVVRQAIEHYLADFEDLNLAVARLKDPTDPALDWDEAKRALLDQD